GNSRERLYVSVDSAGQVYVDKSPVPLGLLYDVLVQHKLQAPNGIIVLYASRSARYEDVVRVLDLLRTVGGDRVALATLPNDASLDPTQGKSQTLEEVLRDQGVPVSPNGQIDPSAIPTSPQPGTIQPGTVQPGTSQPLSPSTLPPISSPTTPTSPSPAPGSAPIAPALP
ncbi:MAG: biopolymer transporter ExbD, partial [Cyanobacteria bacterium J06553_1]